MLARGAVFLIVRIHRASDIKETLRVYVKSFLYKNASVEEVPLCASVSLVEGEKYLLCSGNIARVEMPADLGKLGVAR